MPMGLMSLKAPPRHFPFIFVSVSLPVENLTLYFQEVYKLPESLKKRGDKNIYKGRLIRLQQGFKADKLPSAG